ncbi:MAG: twin-arginine translocase TatA/TatE family subunit [Dehalococcoidia bacterium]|nr:twin-arginine translocase TatA/TatE family subunit [Dehalococcoidia bacterium]
MRIGPLELLLVLAIVLLVFGAGRLPELGAALPRAAKNFRRGLEEPDVAEPTAGSESARATPIGETAASAPSSSVATRAPRGRLRPLGMTLAGVALLLLYLGLSDISMGWPNEARLGTLAAGGVALVVALALSLVA